MTTPEEELYVLLFEQGLRGWPSNSRELATGTAASISDIKIIKQNIGDKYGKTKIAKLQFVEEE